jgi:LPS O-antigen subunit length determinant protein (WzzB/FepE family)
MTEEVAMQVERENFQIYEDIDLMKLFVILLGGRWKIISLTFISAALSVVYSLSLPNTYTSEILLIPAESRSGGLNALSRAGGLANLAGVNLGSSKVSSVSLGLVTLKSRAFITEFIERRDILVELMALDSWNDERTEINTEIYDVETNTWRVKKPGSQAAYSKFMSSFSFSQDPKHGTLKLAISNQSPFLAQQWVTWLVEDLNQSMRERDIKEAERAVELLESQIQSTALVGMKSMFFRLIEDRTETILLASVRPDYLFKIIDPAIIPEDKSSPNRAVLCILGTLFGGFLSVIIVFLSHFRSLRRDPNLD